MKLIAKRNFTWAEPKDFLQIRDRMDREATEWWRPLLFAVLIMLVLLATWGLAHLNPDKHPPSFEVALGLAIFGGVLFAYVPPRVIPWIPSKIILFDHGILRTRLGNRITKYDQLRSFAWRESAGDYATLVLTDRGGREIWIGVPGDVSAQSVSDFLHGRGLSTADLG